MKTSQNVAFGWFVQIDENGTLKIDGVNLEDNTNEDLRFYFKPLI